MNTLFGTFDSDSEDESCDLHHQNDPLGYQDQDTESNKLDHIIQLRKYNNTKAKIPFSIYHSDYMKSDEKSEKRKIKSFFRRYLPKQRKSVKDDSEDENDEESKHISGDEEEDQDRENETDEKVFIPGENERVQLSWPYWTFESEQIGMTNFAPPIFTCKNYYIDLMFRAPYGKNSFNAETLECLMKMNKDTIIAQTQGRVSFTGGQFNVLPLSIEVIRERSNLPGIWDKCIVTKDHSPFVPGVQCALSGETKSLVCNPVFSGDSVGDSVCTPVMYELHSSYTTNPDVVRFINVDFERLKSQIEQNLGTMDTKYVVLHENDTLQNDLKFLILSYFDEIVNCIKDPVLRKKKNIIDKKNKVIKIPYIAIFDWVAKKKSLVDKERKLMDMKDIQLKLKPASASDTKYIKALIENKRFNLEEVDYLCHVRMHYIPLRNAVQNQSSSSSSSSDSVSPPGQVVVNIPRVKDSHVQNLGFIYPSLT